MRILIDGRLVLPYMTGIGRYILGLVDGFKSLSNENSIELWVQDNCVEHHPVWELESENISLKKIPVRHMGISQHWQVPITMRSHHFDLFHYPHFDLPLLTPIPSVATIHDLIYITHPEFFPQLGNFKRFLMLVMMRLTVQRARYTITVSESSRIDILRYLKADPKKVVVIPEGVDQRFVQPSKSDEDKAVREKYGLHTPFLFFVGERRPHKNIIGLIRAFQKFTEDSGSNYHLVISGKPYGDYSGPENMVRSLGLTQKVHFQYISDNDLPAMYRAADVFVTLSHYEGFGLPVLESMASGTPVVAAKKSSLPEVVGDAGILVDPENYREVAEAIIMLTPGGNQRERRIQLGYERVNHYSWENCARKTLEVYTKAISL